MAFAASAARIRRNAHAIAAVTCGIVMGILFASNVGLFQAQHFEGQLVSIPASSDSSIPDDIVPTSQSSETSSASLMRSSEKSDEHQEQQSVTSKHPAAPIERSQGSLPISSSEQTSSSEPIRQEPKSGESSISSKSSRSSEVFPPFLHTSFPVATVPNWGAMRTPDEWNRTYKELTPDDFVPIPRYDLSVLTIPMDSLTTPLRDENIPKITAKLFYSTRFLGSYSVDAGEFTGTHPALDLKLARGTPIGAVAGGRVSYVENTAMYGLLVVIEHRTKSGETYYSMYGHLDAAFVRAGETIIPGQSLGLVGMTGETTAPHLHLQIDLGAPGETHHVPYLPSSIPSPEEAGTHVVNPITFIGKYRSGD